MPAFQNAVMKKSQIGDYTVQPKKSNGEPCLQEYQSFKRVVSANYPKRSYAELVQVIGLQYKTQFPNLTNLLSIGLVIPVSSVPCERGFSTQNRIKTKLRTSLNNRSLNTLHRISEEGPDILDFDFEDALAKWYKAKKRKIAVKFKVRQGKK